VGAPSVLLADIAGTAQPGASTGPRRLGRQKNPKPEAPGAPVREAYIAAYASAHGAAPPMAAADNTAARRLVDQMGVAPAVELVRAVFANDKVRQRYPSIRKIAVDPAAVQGALASSSWATELTEAQRKYARDLVRRHPEHPISTAVKNERRAPPPEEFQRLCDADKRSATAAARVQGDPTGRFGTAAARAHVPEVPIDDGGGF
jgi:hypothetical protein